MSIEKEFTSFEKHPKTTIAKWVLFLAILFGAVGMLAKGLMPVNKMIERQTLVNSHQYIEGMEQRARILEANIAEINAMIATNPDNVNELLAQKRALSAQLNATIKR